MTTAATLAVRIAANINDFSPKLNKAERDFVKAAKKIQDTGKTMSMAITVPALAVGGAMVKMAADAEEAGSKFDAVFGRNTKAMGAWVKEARRSIPATSAELKGMTSEIHDLLVPLGMAPGAAMKMTQSVTTLAADLASFNNIPMDDALARIRSGLVGQYEPLLKFGAALSASTVKAEALRLGLIKKGEELNANARAQAAYSLLVKSTTAAHGDAAKTANSTSNQFKFLAAEVKETGIAFGQILIPAVTPAVKALRNMLGTISDLPTPMKAATTGIVGIAAAAGPAVYVVGALAEKAIYLRRALIGLGAGSALAGFLTATPWVLGAAVAVGAIALALNHSGKAARDAAADLETYQQKLAKITSTSGLQFETHSLQGQYDYLRKQRDDLNATRWVTPMTEEQRKDPVQRGIIIAGDNQKNFALDQQIGALDTQLTRVAARMREAGTAYGDMVTAAKDAAEARRKAEADAAAAAAASVTWIDRMEDRVGQLTTAFGFTKQGAEPIKGLNLAIANALGVVDSALAKAGNRVNDYTNKLRGMRAGLLATMEPLEKAQAHLNSSPLGATLGTSAPGAVKALSKVVVPAGAGGIADNTQTTSQLRLLQTAVVSELKTVPAAIAQNLAQFLGPVFAKMGAGGATGGLIGSSVGGAVGTGFGNRAGGVLGSLMGPLGGIVGGFIGAGIGAGLGKLFGKPKKKTDEAADSLGKLAKAAERVSEALINVPQGFRVAAARYAATDPSRGGPSSSNPGPQPPATNPGPGPRADSGGASFNFNAPITVVTQSPDDFLDQLRVKAERAASRGGSSPLLAFR